MIITPERTEKKFFIFYTFLIIFVFNILIVWRIREKIRVTDKTMLSKIKVEITHANRIKKKIPIERR